MPTVIFSERDFMKAIIEGSTSPLGKVRVPSTSKRAMMRGFVGVGVAIFCLFVVRVGLCGRCFRSLVIATADR